VSDSYVFRTVRNLSLNTLNKSETKFTDLVEDLDSSISQTELLTLEDQFESTQRFELFCQAVRTLPLKCQRVFILRKVYGFSQKEIAERMEISIKTVEAHLTKGIVLCTDFMDEAESEHTGTVVDAPQKFVRAR